MRTRKKSKKILLITAPRPKADESALHFGDCRPPQGLGYIAAYLEQAGHKTRILDLYHFGQEKIGRNSRVAIQEEPSQLLTIDLDREIDSFKPDFIGMYIHTMSFYQACELGKILKEKYSDIPLMCGGPHPTVLPETIPDYFEYVVRGEGEYTALDIVEGKKKRRIILGTKAKNLDELPWPNYDWFINKPYNWKLKLFNRDSIEPVLSFNTSRGCPFRCKFCAVHSISGVGFRAVSPEVIVSKLLEYKKKYQIKGAYFREDNFTANLARLEKFCDLAIKNQLNIIWAAESRVRGLTEPIVKKMALSGCIGLYIGLESGSPRMLHYMNKGETVEDFLEKIPLLKSYGISTYLTWMVGLPTETQEDRLLTTKLINRLKPTANDGFVYLGVPKSDFYNQLDKSKEYEFKEPNGLIYPKGFLSLAQSLYGKDDSRYIYVKKLYEKYNVQPVYIDY